MADLAVWQKKIQDIKKKTPFRKFIMDVASWQPFMVYNNQKLFSRFSPDRVQNIVSVDDYNVLRESFCETTWRDIVTSENFFMQMHAMYKTMPLICVIQDDANENASYADTVIESKNIYLSFNVVASENVLYSYNIKASTNVVESIAVWSKCEHVYQSAGVIKSYQIYNSSSVKDSSNIYFSHNLIWCNECIGCSDLTNMSYCIDNVQYEKEEYENLKAAAILNKRQSWYVVASSPLMLSVENYESANYVFNAKNIRNAYFVGGKREKSDIYDAFSCGFDGDFYWVVSTWWGSQYLYNCVNMGESYMMFYCQNCTSSSYCFWCIWLINKQYCILNKQYTKEERHEKVDQILAHMEKEGQLGDFFPWRMNPFYFNDTGAYLVDGTFTKEEVAAAWFVRRDAPVKADIPDRMETIHTADLDQYEWYNEWIRTIDPAILKKVIVDGEGNSYRVVKLEYDFLVKHGLPLPRKHWLQRLKDNFRL